MAIRKLRAASIALCAAASAFLAPAAANAQAAPASVASLAWSKTEAILGAPSALQSILAQQHETGRAAQVAPASYSLPPLVNAVARSRPEDDGGVNGRPDVFGTVALKVGRTPLDARWNAVEHSPVTGAPAKFAATLKGFSAIEQLELVNNFVNHRVRYEDDSKRFGRPDVWSSANETLRRGRGDCEDYAIAKLQMLRAAGFSSRDLYLVIVRDLVRRADHAVLVARAASRLYVLDDGTDEVLDSRNVPDYRPMLTFASYGEWTHGYRVQQPQAVASLASDDQRSRSASLLALRAGFKR
ncbi:MAG TPA: transglutaminase-like cysteine peptidase [Sphingomicrobium sp.]|jgi:predicted transglutaminase-like cysteine proteinase|nr:transglutaminase-like cysteine peptidase [Sphingomicrobium sp.]